MASTTSKIQAIHTFSGAVTGSVTGQALDTDTSPAANDTNFAAATTNGSFTMAFTKANLQSFYLVADQNCTVKTNGTGTADVQTITITGTPTGGSFAVDFGGAATILAFNASSATVQTALQALSTIGSGNVTCTGGPLPGTPVVCTFAGTKSTGFQALMTAYSGALTGGSSPTVTITHTTSGLPSETITLVANIPYWWETSGGQANPFVGNVTGAFVTCTPATTVKVRILQS